MLMAGVPNARHGTNACSRNDTTSIPEIQGTGAASPFVGDSVKTTGIVTRVNNNGYYLQDEAGDGNPATSDGIFVFTGSAPTVTAGQKVELVGVVTEFNTGAASNADTAAHTVTELTGTSSVTILGSGDQVEPGPRTGRARPPAQRSLDTERRGALTWVVDMLTLRGLAQPASSLRDMTA